MKLIRNDDFDRIVRTAEDARDKHPVSHNRVRLKTFAETAIRGLNAIKNAEKIGPDELRDDDIIVYTHSENLGTRRYPDYFRDLCWYSAKEWAKGPVTMTLKWLGVRVRYDEIWVVR